MDARTTVADNVGDFGGANGSDVAVAESLNLRLVAAFGSSVTVEPLVSPARMGRRIAGVDLLSPLSPEQVTVMIELVDRYQVVCFSGHD
jgi:alpha-ketoglutarate-dependent taurine dioxygenase